MKNKYKFLAVIGVFLMSAFGGAFSANTIAEKKRIDINQNDVNDLINSGEYETVYSYNDTLKKYYDETSRKIKELGKNLDISFDIFCNQYRDCGLSIDEYTNCLISDSIQSDEIGKQGPARGSYVDVDYRLPSLGNSNEPEITPNEAFKRMPIYGDYDFSNLKEGDIILETFQQFPLMPNFGHVGIIYNTHKKYYTNRNNTIVSEYIQTIDAVYGGLQLCLLDDQRVIDFGIIVIRPKTTDEIIKKALQFQYDRLGAEYDLDSASRVIHSVDPNKEKWYCSEIIYAAFYNSGFKIEGIKDGACWPYHIYNSISVEEISLSNHLCVGLRSKFPYGSNIHVENNTGEDILASYNYHGQNCEFVFKNNWTIYDLDAEDVESITFTHHKMNYYFYTTCDDLHTGYDGYNPGRMVVRHTVDKEKAPYTKSIRLTSNTSDSFKVMNESIETPYYANEYTITADKSGYRMFQCSSDEDMEMALFKNGKLVAGWDNKNNGFGGSEFFTAYLEANTEYVLAVEKNQSKVKSYNEEIDFNLVIASVGKNYENSDEILNLSNAYKNGGHYNTFKFNSGEVGLGVFVPDMSFEYEFVPAYSTPFNILIFDGKTGKNISTTTNSNGIKKAYLENGREYLVVLQNTNSKDEACNIGLYVAYDSERYVAPQTPSKISLNNRYYETRFVLNQGGYVDYWYSFESDGFRIFQTLGGSTFMRLELFDDKCNLLASDELGTASGKGKHLNNYVCYNVKAGQSYRLRVTSLEPTASYGSYIKLAITPVSKNYAKFSDLPQLSASFTGNDNKATINYCENAVGRFTASESGTYTFTMSSTEVSDTYLYVIDVDSSEKIVFERDYDDDGNGDHAKIVRTLTKGRTYFVICTSYNFVDDYGDVNLNIVCPSHTIQSVAETGGYPLTFYFENGDGSYQGGVYIPKQTGYMVLDTTSGNENVYCKTDIVVKDINGKVIPAYSQVTINGKMKVKYAFSVGQPYFIYLKAYDFAQNNIAVKMYLSVTDGYSLIPNKSETVSISAGDRYNEKNCYLSGAQKMEYTYTFGSSGTKLFQTFGDKSVYMQLFNENGTCVKSNMNSGANKNNAFFTYDVVAGKKYVLHVYFSNVGDSGEIKTTVTPVKGSINGFTGISQFSVGTSPLNLVFTRTKNTSSVYTIKPTIDGTYSFTTQQIGSTYDSSADAFMYVVDPSSTDLLQRDVDYNDDMASGNRQSKVTLELEAGKTYYVVISTFTLSAATRQMGLRVEKIA